MKSFEIIEEGRLSKSELNKIIGGQGTFLCVMQAIMYHVRDCNTNSGQLSTCRGYISCVDTNKTSCRPYTGQTGPAGDGEPYNPATTVPDSYAIADSCCEESTVSTDYP